MKKSVAYTAGAVVPLKCVVVPPAGVVLPLLPLPLLLVLLVAPPPDEVEAPAEVEVEVEEAPQ